MHDRGSGWLMDSREIRFPADLPHSTWQKLQNLVSKNGTIPPVPVRQSTRSTWSTQSLLKLCQQQHLCCPVLHLSNSRKRNALHLLLCCARALHSMIGQCVSAVGLQQLPASCMHYYYFVSVLWTSWPCLLTGSSC